MKKLFKLITLISFIFIFSDCSHEDVPPASTITQAFQTVTNDALGAQSGISVAISVLGPPSTPTHAFCYAIWGAWTGLSASGAWGSNRCNWPGQNYNLNIDSINAIALSFYDTSFNNIQFSTIGELHNTVLHQWALNPASDKFEINDETLAFVFNTTTTELRSLGYGSCMNRGDYPEFDEYGNSLTMMGINSLPNSENGYSINDLFERCDYYALENPDCAESFILIKTILSDIYDNFEDEIYVKEKIRNELNKINSNYYNYTPINFTMSVTIMNIFVYSYCYWNAYYSN